MTIKDEMHSWFQGLGYEEGFSLGEVPSTKVRKRHIHIYVILSVVNLRERMMIFSEIGGFTFF